MLVPRPVLMGRKTSASGSAKIFEVAFKRSDTAGIYVPDFLLEGLTACHLGTHYRRSVKAWRQG